MEGTRGRLSVLHLRMSSFGKLAEALVMQQFFVTGYCVDSLPCRMNLFSVSAFTYSGFFANSHLCYLLHNSSSGRRRDFLRNSPGADDGGDAYISKLGHI
jgi:hypothetical protein